MMKCSGLGSSEGREVNQAADALKKATVPVLFIHGDEDDFVFDW